MPSSVGWLLPAAGRRSARPPLLSGDSAGRPRRDVYFETKGLPWQQGGIDYVWSNTLAVGTITERGAASLGQWRMAKRNLEEDYERCFGDDPLDVIAIGVMTDTDNTAGEAVAYYDDLQVSRVRQE